MRIRTFCILYCFSLLLPAQAQKPYWQQQVNYKIDVQLNDTSNTLDGFIKMEYINNSPDTLRYIWIHLWPNAYKNDRTAFSDQQLENGNTAFYFSSNENRGYINRLSFRVNSIAAATEDHPQHQDIIKLLLPAPLAPAATCKIETPFHVKLPYNFSRGGHMGQAYQITQWYPKPAVYDRAGWHPMPYLDEGEFYSEFGNYDVQVTVPENYVVAATGNLQETAEKEWLNKRSLFITPVVKKKTGSKITKEDSIPSAAKTKTLHYLQNNVHDFAWFADKRLSVKTGELQLPSGRKIACYAFFYAKNESTWANSINQIKQAIVTKSNWLGEYPYDVVSVVEDTRSDGGMEYPTITFLSSGGSKKMLDFVINHEVGHNWFYGILASNEREHPWMDEGMNTYYDNRYAMQYYGTTGFDFAGSRSSFISKRMPGDIQQVMLQTVFAAKADQPIELPAATFNSTNYGNIVYVKTGNWMQHLEQQLGKELFDSCMKTYYRQWAFKHPYPADFKAVMEQTSGRNLDSIFSLLNKKGAVGAPAAKKDIRLATFFSLKETDKHQYIFVAPAVGYNFYDKLMPGLLLHNYTLPPARLQFAAAALYSPKTKSLNGLGKVSYSWFNGSGGAKTEVSVSAARFNRDAFTDSTGTVNYMRFSKIVPSVKYVFGKKSSRSSITKYLQWKTYLINEQELLFTRDTIKQIDVITYPVKTRYLNQLQFVIENDRELYPWKGIWMAEQGKGFVRATFTGNYFFNYSPTSGLNLRLFAGKFMYTGAKTFVAELETDRYHLNMTGPRGNEDYTYSNYFAGRSEFDKLLSQQLMIRDGAFKTGTDLLFNKAGRTDNWLAAINLTSDIPDAVNLLKVLPIKIPLKVFADIGTSAATWKADAGTGRFLYDAGLQLPLLKGTVNIYLPLLYSKVFKDYYDLYVPEKRFSKKIAFSINFSSQLLKKAMPFSGF